MPTNTASASSRSASIRKGQRGTALPLRSCWTRPRRYGSLSWYQGRTRIAELAGPTRRQRRPPPRISPRRGRGMEKQSVRKHARRETEQKAIDHKRRTASPPAKEPARSRPTPRIWRPERWIGSRPCAKPPPEPRSPRSGRAAAGRRNPPPTEPRPILGELDLYLTGEGNHQRLYDKMGAHLVEIDGVQGSASRSGPQRHRGERYRRLQQLGRPVSSHAQHGRFGDLVHIRARPQDR